MGSGLDLLASSAGARVFINKSSRSVSSWNEQGGRRNEPTDVKSAGKTAGGAASQPTSRKGREDMQDQTGEKKVSKSDSSKRHHPIETTPTPPNPDPPVDGTVRPPYDGPGGGKGHHKKK
jgi:hypothetical protein